MKAEDKFYFGKPDVMATPMGEHGVVGKLVSRAIREGAEAYRAGKPAVLNARDPKYKGMSAKELEVYGNFWMRGWDGERIKDASAKPTGRGLDLPGMRFSRPGEPERFADGTESFLTIKGVRYRIVGTRKDARGNLVYDLHGTSKTAHPVPFTLVKFLDDGRWVLWGAHGGEVSRGKIEASRPGQPERFEETYRGEVIYLDRYARVAAKNNGYAIVFRTESEAKSFISRHRLSTRGAHPMLFKGNWYVRVPENTPKFSRPGQPEQFGLEDACWEGYEPVGTKQKDGRTVPNCVPKDENEQPEEFAITLSDLNYAKSQIRSASPERLREIEKELLPLAKSGDSNAKTLLDYLKQEWDERYRSTYSRPGQPDKFDASSLDRGNFAEASTSPMLGKLLSEKVMPEGGWRAVETGGGALVISFEDADLARDFGRRAASKGYNATSPVQAIGRYWNVEVKNGK